MDDRSGRHRAADRRCAVRVERRGRRSDRCPLRPGGECVGGGALVTASAACESATTVGYELAGAADAPVVLALGGISAHRHVVSHPDAPSPGWWEGLAG